jgi:uncharacterized repeat protein (TIGR03803 family)
MSCDRNLRTLGGVLPAIIMVLVLTTGAWAQSKYKTLHRFTNGRDGAYPGAGLIFDAAGNLYGTSFGKGSQHLFGNVFKLMPNANGGWTENNLYNFKGGRDGADPVGGVIFDAAGNLYGTTASGGDHLARGGVVFKLTPNANGRWTESVLYTFRRGTDGGIPLADLIFNQAGNLYGTTFLGGFYGYGVVFELTPNANGSWTYNVIYTFTGGADGGSPLAGLIVDQTGNLYGTAEGGTLVGGVVFKLTPNGHGSWTQSVLENFTGPNGDQPLAGVIFDQAGNLYGTTAYGGNLSQCGGIGCGVLFELTPNATGGWKQQILHSFVGVDGAKPMASLTFDAAGNLYGTTSQGGDVTCGCGTVFKLAATSKGQWEETVLHDFLARPGANPRAGLIFDAVGNLYGTTDGYPSTHAYGSVFEITP